eukprot:7927545-Pyramimonas_sp.AAC.1
MKKTRSRFFVVGAKSTMHYGAASHGFTPSEIKRLRGLAASVSPHHCKRAEMNMWWASVADNDPLNMMGASLERWCLEWWSATSTRPGLRTHRDKLSAKELACVFINVAKAGLANSKFKTWLAKSRGP